MIMKSVEIYAPASIGNMGSGFDVFGMAIEGAGDRLIVERAPAGTLVINRLTGDPDLPLDPHKNIVTRVGAAVLEAADSRIGLRFEVHKETVAGSGLGSSAASACAAAVGVNELLGRPFDNHQLLELAGVGEQMASGSLHYDNLAPALLGGFCIIRSAQPLEVLTLAPPDKLWLVIIRPGVVIKTSAAKKILPDQLALPTAIRQFGNIAGVVVAMQHQDIALLGRAIEDYVAAPARSPLIPHFEKARQAALAAGALGFAIAGSGPAMFAVCDNPVSSRQVLAALQKVYIHDTRAKAWITRPDHTGTRILSKA